MSTPTGPLPAGAVPPAQPGEFAPLRLGPLAVWPPVVLAPMAGVTNWPFRRLCREFGAGLYVSEMITARGFLEANARTRLLARGGPDERPRSIQVYGHDPAEIGAMVRALVDDGVDHVDVNFGCPVPKVTRHGGGAAIPARPRLMAAIVRAAVRSAGRVPVTVKVRKGLDDRIPTFRDAGRVAEEEGAAAIGLHARTAAQLYAGRADWDAIAELKVRVRIPVLGNGDVWEAADALRMMRATGCDAVIVGRGCLGRPWVFRDLAAAFDGRPPAPPPTLGAVVDVMRRHAAMLVDFFGPVNGIRHMRKWGTWYVAGFPGARAARAALTRIETLDDLAAVLDGFDRDETTTAPPPSRETRVQARVALPPGWLDARDDAAPPSMPPAAWEALAGG